MPATKRTGSSRKVFLEGPGSRGQRALPKNPSGIKFYSIFKRKRRVLYFREVTNAKHSEGVRPPSARETGIGRRVQSPVGSYMRFLLFIQSKSGRFRLFAYK